MVPSPIGAYVTASEYERLKQKLAQIVTQAKDYLLQVEARQIGAAEAATCLKVIMDLGD